MLATLRAGFAYVPLGLDWPTPRIAAVLPDSTPKIVPISSALTSRYRRFFGRALSGLKMVGHLLSRPSQEGNCRSHFEGSAMPVVYTSDLAYVMYTSGSSGTPKGVMIQHGALSNSLQKHCRILRLSSPSKLLHSLHGRLMYRVSISSAIWPEEQFSALGIEEFFTFKASRSCRFDANYASGNYSHNRSLLKPRRVSNNRNLRRWRRINDKTGVGDLVYYRQTVERI